MDVPENCQICDLVYIVNTVFLDSFTEALFSRQWGFGFQGFRGSGFRGSGVQGFHISSLERFCFYVLV